jgi:ABC-type amino acid transport system permease subunit
MGGSSSVFLGSSRASDSSAALSQAPVRASLFSKGGKKAQQKEVAAWEDWEFDTPRSHMSKEQGPGHRHRTTQELVDVIAAIAKGQKGQMRGLVALGIEVKKGATLNDIIAAATKKYGGAAEELANSTGGKVLSAQIAFNESMEAFGYKFLPLVQKGLEWVVQTGLPAFEQGLSALAPKLISLVENQVIPLFESFNNLTKALGFTGGAFQLLGTIIYMTWIPAAAFAAVPKNLEEAARDAGASKFRVFRGITLRMAAPGILVAMVMSFISAFDEAQGTYLVGSPEIFTMPTEMYSLVLTYPVQIAAVFSILLAVPSVILIGLARKQIIGGQLAEGFQIK